MDNGGSEEKPPEKRPSPFQRLNLNIQKQDENFRKKLADSILSKKFVWTILTLVLWTVLVALAFLFFRLLEYKVRLGTISEVVGRFITSPGAAGLAALLAAIIGANMISKQLKLARATAHESEWWSKFEWVTERALPSVNDHVRIPVHVAVNFLNQLQKSAQSDIQQEACGGFVDHLAALLVEPELEQSEPGGPVAPNPVKPDPVVPVPIKPGRVKANPVVRDSVKPLPRKGQQYTLHPVESGDRAITAWVAYAKDTKDTPARSIEANLIAEEMISTLKKRKEYEHKAITALSKVDGVTISRIARGSREGLPSAYIRYGGSQVAVVIRHSSSEKKHLVKENRGENARTVISLDKLNPDDNRVLVISNDSIEPLIRPVLDRKSEFVAWWPEDRADDPRSELVPLESALKRLTS